MWIVFEVKTIGEMKAISNGFETKDEAISFRQTMLEGFLYKGANLMFAFVDDNYDNQL